jgi:hypothetical protein
MSGIYTTPDGQKVHGDGKPVGKPPSASSFVPAPGSVASPYAVKQRKDGVWCIYMRRYNCVVAEFGKANRYDAEVIGAILDGKPQDWPSQTFDENPNLQRGKQPQ